MNQVMNRFELVDATVIIHYSRSIRVKAVECSKTSVFRSCSRKRSIRKPSKNSYVVSIESHHIGFTANCFSLKGGFLGVRCVGRSSFASPSPLGLRNSAVALASRALASSERRSQRRHDAVFVQVNRATLRLNNVERETGGPKPKILKNI